MTQFAPGLIIEVLLILLLLATVGYCMVLNRRLAHLRSSQDDLRQIISELGAATQTAETAIRGLKATTEEADVRLTDKLHKAQLLTRELSVLTEAPPQARPTAVQPSPVAPAEPVAPPAPKASIQRQAPPDPEAWRQIAMARLKQAS